MDQFNSVLPWAHQPTPSTAAPYSVAASFPTATVSGPPPPNYASHQQPPNFAATAPPPPPPTTTAPPVEAPVAIHQPVGVYSGGPVPSIAEMIFSAIGALKERDGSSKRAITKYIDHFYPGLAPPAELTQTLQQLKTNGSLVMFKKSYKIPGSDFTPNINELPDVSREPLDAPVQQLPPPPPPLTSSEAVATLSPSVAPKRGRGRPPKVKPADVLPNGHQPEPEAVVSQSETYNILPPGFAPNGQHTDNHSSAIPDVNAEVVAQPVTEPIGAAEEEPNVVKRRPGRPPKKSLGVDSGGIVIGKRGRGRPPKSGLKKRILGRPRKYKTKTVVDVSGVNGYTRRPGRPPKNQTNSLNVPYDTTGEAMPMPGSVPRPRGRPRKGTGLIAAGVGVGGLNEKLLGLPHNVSGGLSEPRRSGRPVGRPKKYVDKSDSEPEGESEAESEGETEAGAVGDSDAERVFRMKLEFFQLRVQGIVGVLRPMLSDEAPSDVVAAVGELEKLAEMDIDQPVRVEQSGAFTGGAPGAVES